MRFNLANVEIDNRDSETTWLHIRSHPEFQDDITLELTRNDLLELIANMDENNPKEEDL